MTVLFYNISKPYIESMYIYTYIHKSNKRLLLSTGLALSENSDY